VNSHRARQLASYPAGRPTPDGKRAGDDPCQAYIDQTSAGQWPSRDRGV